MPRNNVQATVEKKKKRFQKLDTYAKFRSQSIPNFVCQNQQAEVLINETNNKINVVQKSTIHPDLEHPIT
jgi:hypothetical protein